MTTAKPTQTDAKGRPILHHLNADTSWLIQLPIPSSSPSSPVTASPTSPSQYTTSEETLQSPPDNTRRYYNILLDPWLSGTQSDVASWFSKQWHSITPSYNSIAAVQALCAASELTVADVSSLSTTRGTKQGMDDIFQNPVIHEDDTSIKAEGKQVQWQGKSYIDAVAISHEFTDHCHKTTLLELPKETPVFAWSKAAKLIRGWGHFEEVIEVGRFKGDWTANNSDRLPDWLSIGWLINDSNNLYYHSALIISFVLSPGSTSPPPAECIVYTPHGLHAPTLAPLYSPAPSPPLQPLCLLHGLHDISLNWRQQLNLGAHAGLAAQRKIGARYWFPTHDEEKVGKGVVSWFLNRKRVAVGDALREEGRRLDRESQDRSGRVEGEKEWEEKEKEKVGFGVLGNGDWVVLK